jgi:D-alanyl-D-alanine carboxypeptidase
MNPIELQAKLEKLAKKAQSKNGNKPFQVLIHSDKHHLHFSYPPVQSNPVFHIASIGKLLTTVLILRYVEAGKLSLEDPLVKTLDPSLLEGLFESDPSTITVLDCLTHRSGAADFFEGKDERGKPFLTMIMENPDTVWTQDMLLNYARHHLKPVGKRGEKYAYGDTAFMLATMVLEKIEGKPLNQLLQEELFDPLGMNDSQAMIYKYPLGIAKAPQDIWLDTHEVKSHNILSVDQADGGIVSTPDDLVLFQKALYSGLLINQKHLDLMQQWQGIFRAGIHYGTGMMQIRFNEFFFLMRNFPRLIGHIGVLSTHCFYDQDHDVHIILNFGSTQNMTRSFVFLSNVVGILKSSL